VSVTNLTLSRTGTLNLPTANNFTGTTALNGPTVNLGSAAAIGSGALTVTSGTLQTSATAGLALGNAVTLNNAALTLAGSNNLLFTGAGNIVLGGLNNTPTVTNPAVTALNGAISAPGNLIKAGAGTLILSCPNTYVG